MKHSDGNVLLFAKYIVKQKEIKAGGRLKQTTRQYTTDAFGRVTGITDNLFGSHTYTYDKRGFLTSADGETYEYDANGNITKMGNTVLTYDSVMKDRLASVGGKAVSYATDSSICPTSWDGRSYKFEGRRLVQYDATNRIKFTYNDMGLRTKKQVYYLKTGLSKLMYETEYFYNGDRLVTEICEKIIANKRTETRLDYLYDENGSLYGFVYNKNNKYFYVRDVLQNILGIIDNDGELVVQYTYNAWGKLLETTGALATTIGANNPFRFKGYYYDKETGMYYCQSRYYMPEWGRWLCGDSSAYLRPDGLQQMNLFVYCGNNPISSVDISGNKSESIWKKIFGIFVGIGLLIFTIAAVVSSGGALLIPTLVGAGIGARINLVGQGVANLAAGKNFFDDINWWNVALGGLTGAAFATGYGGMFGAILVGAASNAGMSAFEGNSWANIGFSAVIGGIAAFAGVKFGKYVSNKFLNINTNLGYGNYINMAKIDGANFLSRNLIAFMSTLYTMGASIATGATRGVAKFIGNMIGDRF